jgi:hypothetical protein
MRARRFLPFVDRLDPRIAPSSAVVAAPTPPTATTAATTYDSNDLMGNMNWWGSGPPPNGTYNPANPPIASNTTGS